LNFYEAGEAHSGSLRRGESFIEGDALVLAIFENESNRAQQRAVSKPARWPGRSWPFLRLQ